MGDERRKHERFETPGLKTNISDGNTAFVVVVDDVSKKGVGVSEVPSGFDETVTKCLAVVNGPLRDFELTLQPRWVHVSGKSKNKRIGFQISDPPIEWLDFVEGLKGEDAGRSKRKDQRFSTLGLMAIISDGKARYFGVVESISEHGLRLKQIPPEFDDAGGDCTAVVHSPTGDVHISLRPCWIKSTNRGMYKSVGFQIQNPPEDWQGFIKKMENEAGDLSFFLLKEDDEE